MENKLDLILLEDLARKYGWSNRNSSITSERNADSTRYILDIKNGEGNLEIRLYEYPDGNSKSINLNVYDRKKAYDDYRRILSYSREVGVGKRKNYYRVEIDSAGHYKETDSKFIEMRYTKRTQDAINALKAFAHDKEGFEKLASKKYKK